MPDDNLSLSDKSEEIRDIYTGKLIGRSNRKKGGISE